MRRGLTLIEVLLVLAVLVMVAALAVPSISSLLDGQRLRKSGDQIHGEWAKARNLSRDAAVKALEAETPAGRFGQPPEFGAACAFLCSTHAGYVTGQNWLLDGGAYPGTY